MTFYLHQGGVVMSSRIKHTHTVVKIHLLAHIIDSWALIFSCCALFTVYPTASWKTAFLPSPCDNHQSTGGRSEKTQGQAKMAAFFVLPSSFALRLSALVETVCFLTPHISAKLAILLKRDLHNCNKLWLVIKLSYSLE